MEEHDPAHRGAFFLLVPGQCLGGGGDRGPGGGPGELLRVTVRRDRSAVVVALKGELDLHTQPLAEDAFAQVLTETAPHPSGVIADLSELTFCDSTGLSALISARHRLAANGRPLVLAGVHDRVTQVLRLTGLDRVFGCYATVAEAASALDQDG
ncbi:STAS domain-containing protein [Nonomuraea recticatena]|uniref:STAS domain-containing protein n=1 Tax=Nonomuraea recticatena TaxID=46178 RepID=UPI0036216A03